MEDIKLIKRYCIADICLTVLSTFGILMALFLPYGIMNLSNIQRQGSYLDTIFNHSNLLVIFIIGLIVFVGFYSYDLYLINSKLSVFLLNNVHLNPNFKNYANSLKTLSWFSLSFITSFRILKDIKNEINE